MPYREKLSGIYSISTPNGNVYVGSSVNIYHRWAEHRGYFRRGNHHSIRLQHAFNKHGGSLIFRVLCLCDVKMLNFYEQRFIDGLGATLNTTVFVNNVWTNPETRKKIEATYKTEQFKKTRSEIARRPNCRFVQVASSVGEKFSSMAEAARAYGTTVQHIRHLVGCQTMGRLGVRFKKTSDEWTVEKTQYQKAVETRKGFKHSPATIIKMKEAKVGCRPDPSVGKKGNEVTKTKVIGCPVDGGKEVIFNSQRDAARFVRPDNISTAGSQINKACRGVRPTAYGYKWAYAKRGQA